MKTLLSAFLAFICCICLVGCENMNNQDVGTVSGAIAGGLIGSTVGRGSGQMLAIGAGTLAGAYLGGAIGRDMDINDRRRVYQALEDNEVGEPAYWRNAHSGARYEVVPTRNIERHGNRYCREYRTVADIAGRKQQIYGTACRQPDGSWKAR